VADKYGLRKYMKLGYKSLEAKWDDKTSKWNIKMINLRTGEEFVDTADALLTALGILNEYDRARVMVQTTS
jgi:cation diffusion facilitator CzcD-associated flavoprotein CzcO